MCTFKAYPLPELQSKHLLTIFCYLGQSPSMSAHKNQQKSVTVSKLITTASVQFQTLIHVVTACSPLNDIQDVFKHLTILQLILGLLKCGQILKWVHVVLFVNTGSDNELTSAVHTKIATSSIQLQAFFVFLLLVVLY